MAAVNRVGIVSGKFTAACDSSLTMMQLLSFFFLVLCFFYRVNYVFGSNKIDILSFF